MFLPGWEEGLFPNQRALDDQGRAGLEEERRLAHVGLTRARRRAKIYFASNRRMHGLWNSNIPSRFLDELPEAHVAVMEARGGFGGGYGGMGGGYGNAGASRFDEMTHFGSSYTTPGWQRAQARRAKSARSSNYGEHGFGDADEDGFDEDAQRDYDTDDGLGVHDAASGHAGRTGRATASPPPLRGRAREGGGNKASAAFARDRRRGPLTIEGELVAKSTGTVSDFSIGDRVFHLKFGNGNVTAIDGNKLTIAFDKAGEKRVVDSFVERV